MLEVDDFGSELKSAVVGYGRRRPDLSLPPEDQAKQAQVLVTLTEDSVTNPIVLNDAYRAPLPATFRQFDYNTISDVFLNVGYTARPGGTLLRDRAVENLNELVEAAESQSSCSSSA